MATALAHTALDAPVPRWEIPPMADPADLDRIARLLEVEANVAHDTLRAECRETWPCPREDYSACPIGDHEAWIDAYNALLDAARAVRRAAEVLYAPTDSSVPF